MSGLLRRLDGMSYTRLSVYLLLGAVLCSGLELHQAAYSQDAAAVAKALRTGAAVDAADEHGDTALHVASAHGNEEIAKMLLASGATVSFANDGDTPLHFAAMKGHSAVANLLLQHGAETDGTNGDGRSPLAMFAWFGEGVGVAELLLSKGASPNVADHRGMTPLHIAAASGKTDLVSILVKHLTQGGAADALETQSRDRTTALHSAARGPAVEPMRVLVEAGANVSAVDKDGAAPIHRVAMQTRAGVALEMLRLLVKGGSDVNMRSAADDVPLHLAVMSGNTEMAEALLDLGADIGLADSDSSVTALHLCAAYTRPAMATLLLARGADNSVRDKTGNTPLHLCGTTDSVEVAQLLLGAGCSTAAKNGRGQAPIHVAAAHGSANVVAALLERGHRDQLELKSSKGYTALHECATYGAVATAELLIGAGASLEAAADDGTTPLLRAVIEGNLEVAQLLLREGASLKVTADGPVSHAAPARALAACCCPRPKTPPLTSPPPPPQMNLKNLSVLDFAIVTDRAELMSVLVEHGVGGAMVLVSLRLAVKLGKMDLLQSLCMLDQHTCARLAAEQQAEEKGASVAEYADDKVEGEGLGEGREGGPSSDAEIKKKDEL